MMLTIHGLPINVNYPVLKSIIHKECKLSDFILGVIAHDTDCTKKVRIGVVDEKEGNIIMKSLDGYRFSGHVLRVVPLGKSGNVNSETDNQQQQWRGNQQASNYGHQPNDTFTNRSVSWSGSNTQGGYWSNQQTIQAQIKIEGSSPYAQQNAVQPLYHQQVTTAQSKGFGQQERYIQVKGIQSQGYMSNQERQNSIGNRINVSNTPLRNQPRPLMSTNVEIDDQYANMSNMPVQNSTYSNPNYATNDKPVTIKKEYFQGPSHYNTGDQSSQAQPAYQGQSYNLQYPALKTESYQKHSPTPYEKPYSKAMHPDNRQVHNQMKVEPKGYEYNQYEKTVRRMSPQRDQITDRRQDIQNVRRISPPGHSISPSGHRILPSGRRISPHRRDSPHMSQSSRSRASPEQNASPSGRRYSPTGRRYSPPGRRYSPSGRHMPQSEQGMPSSDRKITDRRVSPSERRVSPSFRRDSPFDHRGATRPGISQAERILTSGRRVSPPGRRISPSGRRISPSERRGSPPGRKLSPMDRRSLVDRRISPSGHRTLSAGPSSIVHGEAATRRLSPSHKEERYVGARISLRTLSPSLAKPLNRTLSPAMRSSDSIRPSPFARLDQRGHLQRYSPPRAEKQIESLFSATDKDMRPPYNPVAQAQTQPMYRGGYPPHARDKQFQTTRPEQRPIWQDREKEYPKPIDERDPPRNQKFDGPRGGPRPLMGQNEKLRSPGRMSRSPNRRDRSPVRDRFRRHSPSPRSPRRSWALEKRRSPEASDVPPPPVWPVKETYGNNNRSNIDRTARASPWDKPYEAKTGQSLSRTDDRGSPERGDRFYASSSRWGPKSSDAEREKPREHSPQARQNERYPHQNETKYSREFETRRRDEYERQPGREHKQYADHDVPRRKSADYHQTDERKPELRTAQNLKMEVKEVFKKEPEFHQPEKHVQKPYYDKLKPDSDQHSRGSRFNQDTRDASTSHNRGAVHPRPSDPHNVDLNPKVQYKRDKAIDEITGKMLHKFAPLLKGTIRDQVEERVKLIIESMVRDMFGVRDAAFIEIVIQFEERHAKDLEGIFDRVLSEFPAEVRCLKRPATGDSHIPAKIPRDSSNSSVNRGAPMQTKRQQVRGETTRRLVPIRRPVVVERGPVLYRSAGARSATATRAGTVQRSAATVKSAPSNKSAQKSFADAAQKPPVQRSATPKSQNNAQAPLKSQSPSIERSTPKSPNVERSASPKSVTVPKSESAKSASPQRSAVKRKLCTVKKLIPLRRIALAKSAAAFCQSPDPPELPPKRTHSPIVVEIEDKCTQKDKSVKKITNLNTKKENQLNPQLTRALDSELQNIMIKVWQEFPDECSTPEEALVAEKFRKEAGDSLRNVLGLSVTKRLLKFENYLYVKIFFSSLPSRACLADFRRKYNMRTFKRIDSSMNMFAAQLSTFEDFDRLCTSKDVYCGRVKVSVKPSYSFTTCPQNLITKFSGPQKGIEKPKTEDKLPEAPNIVTQNKETKGEKKAEVKIDTIQTKPKLTQVKCEPKPVQVKQKTVEVTKIKQNQTNEAEPQRKPTKTNSAQPKETTKVNVTKETKPSKSMENQKAKFKKPEPKTTLKTKPKVEQYEDFDEMDLIGNFDYDEYGMPETHFDEEDELDDKDILTLMSKKIVLDECSDSDIE